MDPSSNPPLAVGSKQHNRRKTYGGDLAASFYVLHVKGDTTLIRNQLDLLARLEAIRVVSCEEFIDALAVS